MPIKSTKQDWSVGKIVNVGFMKGFKVEEICVVKDFLPDIYILSRHGKHYEFIPHNSLTLVQDCQSCLWKNEEGYWCYMFDRRQIGGCMKFQKKKGVS